MSSKKSGLGKGSKRSKLSFEADEEEEQEEPAFQVKKSKQSRTFKKMRQAPGIYYAGSGSSGALGDASLHGQESTNVEEEPLSVSAALGGSYSAEHLASLRQNQNFALPGTSKDAEEIDLLSGHGIREGFDTEAGAEIGTGLSTAGVEGIELCGEEAEEFVELTERAAIRARTNRSTDTAGGDTDGDVDREGSSADMESIRLARINNKQLLKTGSGAGAEGRVFTTAAAVDKCKLYDLTAENDEEWEREVMRRGVINSGALDKTGPTAPVGPKASSRTPHSTGNEAAIQRAAAKGAVTKGAVAAAVQAEAGMITVSDLLRTVQLAVDKLRRAGQEREGQLGRLRAEEEEAAGAEESLRDAVEKGVSRLNAIQELRAYFAGLVGMLREKAPLVEQELAHAIWGTSEAAATTSPPAGAGAGAGTADEGGDSAMASRAAAVKRLRAEEQEDALYRLKQAGEVLALGNYRPVAIMSSKEVVPDADSAAQQVEIATRKHSVVLLEKRERLRREERRALLAGPLRDSSLLLKLAQQQHEGLAGTRAGGEEFNEQEEEEEEKEEVEDAYGAYGGGVGLGFGRKINRTTKEDSIGGNSSSRRSSSNSGSIDRNVLSADEEAMLEKGIILPLATRTFTLVQQQQQLHHPPHSDSEDDGGGVGKSRDNYSPRSSIFDASVFDILDFGSTLRDDELYAPLPDLQAQTATLAQAADALMADVAPHLYSVRAVLRRLRDLRKAFPDNYASAYVPLSAPQLLKPLVLLELLPLAPTLFPHALTAGAVNGAPLFISSSTSSTARQVMRGTSAGRQLQGRGEDDGGFLQYLRRHEWFQPLLRFSREAAAAAGAEEVRREAEAEKGVGTAGTNESKGEVEAADNLNREDITGDEKLFETVLSEVVVPWLSRAVRLSLQTCSTAHCNQCLSLISEMAIALDETHPHPNANPNANPEERAPSGDAARYGAAAVRVLEPVVSTVMSAFSTQMAQLVLPVLKFTDTAGTERKTTAATDCTSFILRQLHRACLQLRNLRALCCSGFLTIQNSQTSAESSSGSSGSSRGLGFGSREDTGTGHSSAVQASGEKARQAAALAWRVLSQDASACLSRVLKVSGNEQAKHLVRGLCEEAVGVVQAALSSLHGPTTETSRGTDSGPSRSTVGGHTSSSSHSPRNCRAAVRPGSAAALVLEECEISVPAYNLLNMTLAQFHNPIPGAPTGNGTAAGEAADASVHSDNRSCSVLDTLRWYESLQQVLNKLSTL